MGKNVFEMIRDFGGRGKIFEVHFRNVTCAAAALRRDLSRRRLHGHVPGDEGAAPGAFNGAAEPDHVPATGRRHRHAARRARRTASPTCARCCGAPTKRSGRAAWQQPIAQ